MITELMGAPTLELTVFYSTTDLLSTLVQITDMSKEGRPIRAFVGTVIEGTVDQMK